ncbi:MAG: nitroreductase family protein [Chloroflexota bacterium]
MAVDDELYQAIMARRSVRRYDDEPLSEDILDQVREIASKVVPLIPDNTFRVLIHDYTPADEGWVLRSAYGRFMTPPHVMVPYVVGEYPLTDLGCRVEQIVVRLTALDIGTCYIGALGAEDGLRSRFGLPAGARIGATVFFGRPASGVGGTVDAVARMLAGGRKRMAVRELFFDGDFGSPSAPPSEIAPLIEAGRWAPSAVNAQPWRFLLREERLMLFVTTGTLKYLGGERGQYPLYDGGICMANIHLAMEALGEGGNWRMGEKGDVQGVEHPDDLELLAVLTLER